VDAWGTPTKPCTAWFCPRRGGIAEGEDRSEGKASHCQQLKPTEAEKHAILEYGGVTWKKNGIEMLTELIQQKCYEARSKRREQDFTRRRKMTFAGVIYFMICSAKMSSQNALERFSGNWGWGPV
jgi:hypothetical protein